MSTRGHVKTFAIALTAAVVASFGLHKALNAPKAQHRIVWLPVVVARQDIRAGAAIEAANLAVAQWPGATPVGAYQVVDSVIGRIARVAIYKGEVFVPNRLADSEVVIRK